MLVGLVGFGALLLLLSATQSDPAPTTTTAALAAPTNPTPRPPRAVTVDGTTFARELSDLQGELVTTVAATSGIPDIDIVNWSGDSRPRWTDLPFAVGDNFGLAADGVTLAFVDPSGTLWFGRREPYQKVTEGVESFSWHESDPTRLAWITTAGLLCVGDRPVPWCTTIGESGLIRYDETGFFTHSEGTLTRLDLSGSVVGTSAADRATIGRSRVLVSVEEEGLRQVSSLDISLSKSETLDWVPEDVAGHINSLSLSPDDQRVAVLRHLGGSDWRVDVYWAWGDPIADFPLRGWFWGLNWAPTGTQMTVIGADERAGDVAVVLDLLSGDRHLFPHDGRVQSAKLLTNRCFDASDSVSRLTSFLEERTEASLLRPWGVVSTEENLESWLFVSAKVSDGLNHGEIATWAVPGFGFVPEPLQITSLLPANDVAASIEPGMVNPHDPDTYGVSSWMDLDGARDSQSCVGD